MTSTCSLAGDSDSAERDGDVVVWRGRRAAAEMYSLPPMEKLETKSLVEDFLWRSTFVSMPSACSWQTGVRPQPDATMERFRQLRQDGKIKILILKESVSVLLP